MSTAIGRLWSWWTGELADIFEGGGGGASNAALALEMEAEAISLIDRHSGAKLAEARIEAPDWDEQLERLRRVARRRAGDPPTIDMLLPRDQTLFAEELFSSEAARDLRSAAYWRIDRLSELSPEDLVYDVSAPRAKESDGAVTALIAIAPRQTIREALDYADEWGLRVGRISTIETSDDFPAGPDFYRNDAPDPKVTGLRALAGLLLIGALGLGGFAAWRALEARGELAAAASQDFGGGAAQIALNRERIEALSSFGAIAAQPTELRETTPPLWRILGAVADALPDGAHLEALRIEAGVLRIEGRTPRLSGLVDTLNEAPFLEAARFAQTDAGDDGGARFVLDATIKGGN